MMRLYLASRSPRRRELLHQIGIDFDTVVFRHGQRADSETDETPTPGENPVDYVERVARAKAIHGLRIVEERRLPMRPVLSADTTLELDGEIIGKPVDRADAAAILRRLSGRTHRVLTGVAVDHQGRSEYLLSISEVTFREIDDEEIRHYVMSGEPMDKAGAYGIQGRAGLFVAHLSGSYTGVMGLPVCETGELLKRLGFRPI
jgi:septum formation protein